MCTTVCLITRARTDSRTIQCRITHHYPWIYLIMVNMTCLCRWLEIVLWDKWSAMIILPLQHTTICCRSHGHVRCVRHWTMSLKPKPKSFTSDKKEEGAYVVDDLQLAKYYTCGHRFATSTHGIVRIGVNQKVIEKSQTGSVFCKTVCYRIDLQMEKKTN